MKKIALLFLSILFSLNSFSQEKDRIETDVDKWVKEQTQNRYIVIAGTSSDFKALDNSAKQISTKTAIVYDNGVEIYDKDDGMIIPKDTIKYDFEAGQSMPRRYDENKISIEMMHFYSDNGALDDTSKMIIVTGIFGNKKDAQKQLTLIQKAIPSAYIKKTQLYMGCTR